MYCTGEVLFLIRIIKVFLDLVKFIMPIALIVLCTFDLFRIVISKKDDDAKKYRKYIYNRIFNCILLFLIPTIIFLLFNILIGGNNLSDVSDIRNCWEIADQNK